MKPTRTRTVQQRLRRNCGVNVKDSNIAITPLHRDTDGFSYTELNNTWCGLPTFILARVARQDAFFILKHIVKDRLTEMNRFSATLVVSIQTRFDLQVAFLIVDQHDAASVGIYRGDNPMQQIHTEFFNIECMTNLLRRPNHHLKIALHAVHRSLVTGRG